MRIDLFTDPAARMTWLLIAMCAGAIILPVVITKGMLWLLNRWADRLSRQSPNKWLSSSTILPIENWFWKAFVFVTVLLYGYSRYGVRTRGGLMAHVDSAGNFHFLGNQMHIPTFELFGLPWKGTDLIFLAIATGWIALPLRLYLISQIKKKREKSGSETS